MIFLKYLLGNFLFFLGYLIPRTNKIWIFGSWGGNKFSDNPKYLFNYISENQTSIMPVWLSRNPEVVKLLLRQGKKAHLLYSFKGIWYAYRAKLGIISHGLVDLNRYTCAGLKIVQTWHGIPMKPVLLSDPKSEAITKRKRLENLSIIFPFLKKELNYKDNLVICSSSDYTTELLHKVFGKDAPLQKVGFPRLDGLFHPEVQNQLYSEILALKKKGYTPGIYMPTYRRKGEFDIIEYFLINFKFIEASLKENNKILYLKIHPFDFFKISSDFSSFHIRWIKDTEINNDIYGILGVFDFLLSDYSSVVFDFLILKKPVFLLVPDRENYITSNGAFVYDYENIGIPIKKTWEDILEIIKTGRSYVDLEKISKRYFQNNDGHNSVRLFDFLINNTK